MRAYVKLQVSTVQQPGLSHQGPAVGCFTMLHQPASYIMPLLSIDPGHLDSSLHVCSTVSTDLEDLLHLPSKALLTEFCSP